MKKNFISNFMVEIFVDRNIMEMLIKEERMEFNFYWIFYYELVIIEIFLYMLCYLKFIIVFEKYY